ncbi:hypothetical protein NBRC116602_30240 [Hyphomicrobiales bacterium 4NK60-0047b]
MYIKDWKEVGVHDFGVRSRLSCLMKGIKSFILPNLQGIVSMF